jgi:hypothetical protein
MQIRSRDNVPEDEAGFSRPDDEGRHTWRLITRETVGSTGII